MVYESSDCSAICLLCYLANIQLKSIVFVFSAPLRAEKTVKPQRSPQRGHGGALHGNGRWVLVWSWCNAGPGHSRWAVVLCDNGPRCYMLLRSMSVWSNIWHIKVLIISLIEFVCQYTVPLNMFNSSQCVQHKNEACRLLIIFDHNENDLTKSFTDPIILNEDCYS